MANAYLDENSRPTLTALSSDGDGSIVDLWADPTTHALLVDATGGGGTPGSPDTSVQFNDGGSFGGDADFTYDKTTNTLNLGATDIVSTLSTGGTFNIEVGGDGEPFTVTTANGTTSGSTGGLMNFLAGNGNGAGDGGGFGMTGGDGGATGDGGTFSLYGGNGGLTSGEGGDITLNAGNVQGSSGNGGAVSINGGYGVNNGGYIELAPGLGDAANGNVIIVDPEGTNAIFDTSLLETTDKTFTFPNATGHFVVSSLPKLSNSLNFYTDETFGTFLTGLSAPSANKLSIDGASNSGILDISGLSSDRTYALPDSSGTLELATPVGLTYVIDGGGSTITTGFKGVLTVPFDMTITGWVLLADQSGSIVVDVWKDTYANYPPTGADSITGADKPTLSSVDKNRNLAVTLWTTAVSANDVIAFNVDSVSTVQRVTLTIIGTKN